MHRSACKLVLVALLVLTACRDDATDPGRREVDPPDALALEVPEEITQAEPFTLTVTALDAAGLPESDWSGAVTLQTSAGTLSPATLQVQNGVASAQVTLTGAAGAITLHAVAGAVASDAVTALVFSTQPAARIEVVPGAALLTAAGATQAFEAQVFDAAGDPTNAPVTWSSNDPAVLEIDADGLATAQAIGSAMITASANGVGSLPTLVVVAQPAADPVLLDDAQILSLPEPVDPAAAYEPGWQYTVRVQNASVQPGDVVIGTGARPLAGRVLQVQDLGTESMLTVELMALAELFTSLRIDERIPLVEIDTNGAGAGVHGRDPLGLALARADSFRVGPFRCSYTVQLPSLKVDPSKAEINQTLYLEVDYADGLNLFMVGGQLSAEVGYRPVFEAVFQGSANCETPPRTFTVPLGTISTMFFGVQVPLGVGFTLDGKLEIAEVGFDVGASASIDVGLGLSCAGGGACTGVRRFEPTRDWHFELITPDPSEQFRVALGAHGYLYARPYIGSRFTSVGSFQFIDAKGGLRQSIDLATTHYQAEDTAYASSFNLQFLVNVDAGKDLQSAIETIGKVLGVPVSGTITFYAQDDTIARSPRGTFAIAPASVMPGDSSQLGEMATFTVDLDPVTYLGMQSVDEVEFFWRHANEDDNGFTLGPARPACTSIEASSGQTNFECETDFLAEHEGVQTFHAFVHAELFGVKLPFPLEVSVDATSSVEVGGTCTVPESIQNDWRLRPLDTSLSSAPAGTTVEFTGTRFDDMAVSVTNETAVAGIADMRWYDFVRVVPDDASRMGELLYVRYRSVASASVSDEDESNDPGDTDFAALVHIGWAMFLPEFRIIFGGRGGATYPGSELAIDTVDVRRFRAGQWVGTEGHVYAQSYRGGSASAAHAFQVLGVFDEAGEEVPATICSALGYEYLRLAE